jgi:hypothetical protein
LIAALAERGHREALQKWIDSLRSPQAKVRALFMLAELNYH